MHWQQTLDAFETSAVEDESLLTAAEAGVLPGATANVVCAVEYRLERKKALATGIKALDAYVEWLSEDDGEDEDGDGEDEEDGGEDGGAEVEAGGEFPGFEDQR